MPGEDNVGTIISVEIPTMAREMDSGKTQSIQNAY
jgi:hypothetical protein